MIENIGREYHKFFKFYFANFIDLLDMEICKNVHLHKIVDPVH